MVLELLQDARQREADQALCRKRMFMENCASHKKVRVAIVVEVFGKNVIYSGMCIVCIFVPFFFLLLFFFFFLKVWFVDLKVSFQRTILKKNISTQCRNNDENSEENSTGSLNSGRKTSTFWHDVDAILLVRDVSESWMTILRKRVSLFLYPYHLLPRQRGTSLLSSSLLSTPLSLWNRGFPLLSVRLCRTRS